MSGEVLCRRFGTSVHARLCDCPDLGACTLAGAKAVDSDEASAQVVSGRSIFRNANPVDLGGAELDEPTAKAVHPEAGESLGDVIQRAARAVADAPFHPTAVPVVHPEQVEAATEAWFGPRRPDVPEGYVPTVQHHTADGGPTRPIIRGPRDNAGRLVQPAGWCAPMESIAHVVPVSREAMEGWPVLDSFVRNAIAFRAEAPPTPERAAELAAEREATAARLRRVRARRAARDVARTAARRARGIHPPCTHEARGDDDW